MESKPEEISFEDFNKELEEKGFYKSKCGCTFWANGRVDGPLLYANFSKKEKE